MRNAVRVLVVDPCPDTRATLALLLQMWGYKVRQAHDGPMALKMAEAYRPDVVVMELCLPEMDGYEVARRLRQRDEGREVLLAAVTGYGGDRYQRLSWEAGFDYHFVKPADPEKLRAVLAETKPEADDFLVRVSEPRVDTWQQRWLAR